jgi:HK97 family phage major capsid protein
MSRTKINDVLELAELLAPSWPEINARIDASGVPTCRAVLDPLRAKLVAIEGDLRDLREERAVAVRERDKARSAYSQSPDRDPASAVFKRATEAAEDLVDVDSRIDATRLAQEGTLRMLGDGQGNADGRDGHGPKAGDLLGDGPGAWLSAMVRMEGGGGEAYGLASPLTTPDFGSLEALDRIFFRRLEQRSALLASGIQTVDIETTSIDIGEITGDMEPAVPTAETDPIAKSDVPLQDVEITPPKFPMLVSMSTEAFNDARPIRLAALETKTLQAIGVGFDAAGFHGAEKSLHPGLAHTPEVGKVEVDKADKAYDWVADAIGDLLGVSGQPALLFFSPFTVKCLLKLKDGVEKYRIADLQTAASNLMGVTVKITRGVEDGEAFMVDPATLVIIRRQEVQTEVFKSYDVEHALVGIRTMMRAQLIAADPRGSVHITGLPTPPKE